MGQVLVKRLCESDAHEEPRILTHRQENIGGGHVRYTCCTCGKITIKCGPSFTDQQLIALHTEGLIDREMAERLGVTRTTVSSRRRKLGIESSRRRIDHQRFLELYEKGLNDQEIANILGVADGTVFNYRKKHGFTTNWKPSFTDQQFLTLYKEGLNDPRIAEKLNASKYVVRLCRQRLGLKAHGHTRLFTDKDLIDLHAQGLNDREKAERLGASEEVVGYHRRKLGLKSNRIRR